MSDLPPVFVASLGRPRGSTFQLLRRLGVSNVTIVCEPQESAAYRDSQPDFAVVVLPRSDGGVHYVRNFVLRQVAPPMGWFWLLDDDIEALFELDDSNVRQKAERSDVFRVPATIASNVACALFGLEYERYLNKADPICNSYCTVCVCINRIRLPPLMRYHFRVREDYDFILQLVCQGRSVSRRRRAAFRVPAQGSNVGGMHVAYRSTSLNGDDERFLAMWSSVFGHQAVHGRNEASATRRVCVQWQRLKPLQLTPSQLSVCRVITTL